MRFVLFLFLFVLCHGSFYSLFSLFIVMVHLIHCHGSSCPLPWFSKEFNLVVFAKSNKMLIFVCYFISTTFLLHLKQHTSEVT